MNTPNPKSPTAPRITSKSESISVRYASNEHSCEFCFLFLCVSYCFQGKKNPMGADSLVGEAKGPTVSHRAIKLCLCGCRYPIALTPGFSPDDIPTCHLIVLELSRANRSGKAATFDGPVRFWRG